MGTQPSKNWQYANMTIGDETLRIGASTGSVVSVDGRSHSPDGSLNTDIEAVRASMVHAGMENPPNGTGRGSRFDWHRWRRRIEYSGASSKDTRRRQTSGRTRFAYGKAKLEELGWRDRNDISDVMRDLEKLAAKDWQVAADLWQKYRPNDIDKPVFIDGDDINEKALTKAGVRDDGRVVDGGKEEEAAGVVTPESLRKRFLQAENKFYFRDDENKLAFEDKGKRLATEHNDPEIARSMVELAQAKGWSTIKLKGTDEFKREVWLQASLKGMDVQGYKPLDVDLARLEDLRKETGRNEDRGRNIIDQVAERSKVGDRAERSEAIDKTAVVDENVCTLSKRQLTALETIKGVMRSRATRKWPSTWPPSWPPNASKPTAFMWARSSTTARRHTKTTRKTNAATT